MSNSNIKRIVAVSVISALVTGAVIGYLDSKNLLPKPTTPKNNNNGSK